MSRSNPLLIEWSSSKVRSFDPVTRQTGVAANIAGALGATVSGREAIVAVAQRSVFVRTVRVPSLGQKELERMIGLEIAPLLPLPASEFVIGFRLGPASGGQGRLAVVAAIKTDLLRKIHQDASAAGLKLVGVTPLAFGAWLAARAHGMAQGAVVQTDGASLSIDILSEGELAYSRAVPVPESAEELSDEIQCTFETAGTSPGTVLSLGDPLPGADALEPKDALEQFASWTAVEKRLIKFDLPEATQAKQRGTLRAVAQRAVVAALAAVALTALAVQKQVEADHRNAAAKSAIVQKLTRANKAEATAKTGYSASQVDLQLIETAFHPAQTFGDIVVEITNLVPPKAWLSGFSMERGKQVLVRGEAADHETVAKYVKALSVDPRFRDTRLVFSEQSTTAKRTTIRFAISFHAMGNLPLVANAEEKKR